MGRQVESLFGAVRVEELRALSQAADEAPRDFDVRRRSGFAHMWAALGGALDLSARAEADLEAAFALRPDDAALTRALGRFYNLRAVDGDRSKAAMQVEVYAAHLGGVAVDAMTDAQFVAWSFSRLGVILELRNRARLLSALGEIESLEDALAARVRRRPDNVELHALAGNFAFFFAGNIPMGRAARVRTAVGHFEVVRARWDAMRRGARDPDRCPNTYENFMFELAEGHLALGDVAKATPIYRELMTVRAPETTAKTQIAAVSAERLSRAERYAGDMDLMPPWPSDVGNCVVCHATTRDVPETSLYTARR
ncbi:MAG: hypothetical protein AAF721_36210 [Myxococcota bacterium]